MPREKVILNESYTIATTGILPTVTASLHRQDFQEWEIREGTASPVYKESWFILRQARLNKKERTQTKSAFRATPLPGIKTETFYKYG